MERDSQGFLMALSSSSFTKNATKIQSKQKPEHAMSCIASILLHRYPFLEYAKLSQDT